MDSGLRLELSDIPGREPCARDAYGKNWLSHS
jgi:hypothetical protein